MVKKDRTQSQEPSWKCLGAHAGFLWFRYKSCLLRFSWFEGFFLCPCTFVDLAAFHFAAMSSMALLSDSLEQMAQHSDSLVLTKPTLDVALSAPCQINFFTL